MDISKIAHKIVFLFCFLCAFCVMAAKVESEIGMPLDYTDELYQETPVRKVKKPIKQLKKPVRKPLRKAPLIKQKQTKKKVYKAAPKRFNQAPNIRPQTKRNVHKAVPKRFNQAPNIRQEINKIAKEIRCMSQKVKDLEKNLELLEKKNNAHSNVKTKNLQENKVSEKKTKQSSNKASPMIVSGTVKEARECLKKGNSEKAKLILSGIVSDNRKLTAIKANSQILYDRVGAHYLLGIIFFLQEKNVLSAQENFEKVCEFYLKGKIIQQRKGDEKEKHIFEFCYRMSLINLVKVFRALGNHREANRVFKSLLNLSNKKFIAVQKEIINLKNEK